VIRVTGARFVAAADDAGRYPDRSVLGGMPPEIAFAGRSNVGKSSLINLLVGRRALARTSSTPGRTRALNFYVITLDRTPLVFVDLPGYGYARVAKTERARWGPLVEGYLEGRRALRGIVLVVDARRGLEDEEHQLMAYLEAHRRPAIIAATKIDKLPRARRQGVLAGMAAAAGRVPVVGMSAESREGRLELWDRLLAAPFAVLEAGRDPGAR
jgi:GTP-binding protein